MSKQITIIGAGISGLTCLHYLKEKYKNRPDVSIALLEKNSQPGGTIQTYLHNDCYFEYGPNGFLDNKPQTFKLVEELGLSDRLIKASEQTKMRFVSLHNRLYPVPTDKDSFLASELFNGLDHLRVGLEVYVPKANKPYESVYNFAKRRLGRKIANVLIDPMVAGIYGGDAKKIVLKAAFPKMFEIEQTHGSLLKALKKIKEKDPDASPFPKAALISFKEGMSEIIHALYGRYKDSIALNTAVLDIQKDGTGFNIKTHERQFKTDYLIAALPAYSCAELFSNIYPEISKRLTQIRYAPVAVLGLVYSCHAFIKKPQGFGYLIPSKQNKEIMGVLFESNIFPGRCAEDRFIFRVMIGGDHRPKTILKDELTLLKLAKKNLKAHFEFKETANHQEFFFKAIPKAIPQYDKTLVQVNEWLNGQLKNLPLRFIANWRGGVSFNDCIENAHKAALQTEV